jgi:hypothetical protein
VDIKKFFSMERFSSRSYSGCLHKDKGKSGAPGHAFFDMHIVDAHQSLVILETASAKYSTSQWIINKLFVRHLRRVTKRDSKRAPLC